MLLRCEKKKAFRALKLSASRSGPSRSFRDRSVDPATERKKETTNYIRVIMAVSYT